jgi:hypothetical protein
LSAECEVYHNPRCAAKTTVKNEALAAAIERDKVLVYER